MECVLRATANVSGGEPDPDLVSGARRNGCTVITFAGNLGIITEVAHRMVNANVNKFKIIHTES